MPDAPQKTSRADELVASRQGGEDGETGHFTLDPLQAKEKLAEHLLDDPHTWVLLVVRAAVARGASRVEVETGPRHVRVTFDGEPFTRSDLDRRYDAVLGEPGARQRPGLLELTLGLVSACQLPVEHVVLESGGEEGLRFVPVLDGEDELTTVDRDGEPRTVVELREEASAEDPHAVALQDSGGRVRRPEEHHLRERARYVPLPVYLDGALVSDGYDRFRCAAVNGSIDHDEVAGRVGVFPWDDAEPTLLMLRNGVVVEAEVLEGRFSPGFLAAVEYDELQLDLSQGTVARNDAYWTVYNAVKRAHRALGGASTVERAAGRWYRKMQAHEAQLTRVAHRLDRVEAAGSTIRILGGGALALAILLVLTSDSSGPMDPDEAILGFVVLLVAVMGLVGLGVVALRRLRGGLVPWLSRRVLRRLVPAAALPEVLEAYGHLDRREVTLTLQPLLEQAAKEAGLVLPLPPDPKRAPGKADG